MRPSYSTDILQNNFHVAVTTNSDEKADNRSNNKNVKFLLGHTDHTAVAAVLCPLQVMWRPLYRLQGRLQALGKQIDLTRQNKRKTFCGPQIMTVRVCRNNWRSAQKFCTRQPVNNYNDVFLFKEADTLIWCKQDMKVSWGLLWSPLLFCITTAWLISSAV